MLLLCDSGGSNGVNRLVFKEQLQRVVDATDLLIKVAHYPPGCSKFNPIDHRLFPHVTRKLQGLFLKSLAMFRDLVKRATTRSGLASSPALFAAYMKSENMPLFNPPINYASVMTVSCPIGIISLYQN